MKAKYRTSPKIVPTQRPKGVRRLVPLKDAYEYGQFGRSKAYHLIAAGKIKAFRMEGRTMIDLNSVDEYHNSLDQLMLQPGRRY